jgi:hypothetical protein
MHRTFVAARAAVVLGFVLVVACASPARPAAWPESREGALARGWVEAFSAGEEAMRRFWNENLAASSLAAKSMDERVASFRSLKERLGTLRLVEIVDATIAHELTVKLADAHGNEHEFTFHLEAAEPYKMTGLVARLTERHGFGFFSHGH